jgi:3-deoxy-D-manno-octulosonic-acid transferase
VGKRRRVWLHTVSVGEFMAAKPILKELRKALPNHEILVSVTTSSGHSTAREAEKGLYDYLVYFPLDVPRFQLAAMQRVQARGAQMRPSLALLKGHGFRQQPKSKIVLPAE